MSLQYAREVLQAEIAALQTVCQRLDTTFEQALDSMLSCGGRVVVCGMGKAGLIGRKISATLASTGTQSFFLHPAEALHGDLGMVAAGDVCLLLSNSGESDEMTRLLPGIRRIGAKIIAITGADRSTLAIQSDIIIHLGRIDEACPLGLAPTATTTAMLAVGDALALCLMKRRNFRIEDYAKFHPAGALGKKSSPIADFMRKEGHMAVVDPQMSVGNVLYAITNARSGAAVVVNPDHTVAGIFCDGDLRRGLERDRDILQKSVDGFMTRGCLVVRGDTVAGEVMELMREKRIAEIPVTDESGKVIGMADLKGLLASL